MCQKNFQFCRVVFLIQKVRLLELTVSTPLQRRRADTMGEPFDINSLSPEDRALFDAMVAEEMMKLERELKEEVDYPVQAPREDERHQYQAKQRDREDFSSTRRPQYEYDEHAVVNAAPVQKSPNSLNPQRLAYKSSEKNDDEGGFNCVGVNFGRNQETADAKRARQQCYADQLRQDQSYQQRPPPRQERSKSAIARRQDASSHDEENFVVGSSRSAGRSRRDDADLSGPRADRVQKQREYARQLESDRLLRDQSQSGQVSHTHSTRSIGVQDGGGSPYSHRSSPAGPPSSSRPPYGAEGNDKLASTREIKSLKQREYARQLEDDRLMRDRSQQQEMSRQDAPRANLHMNVPDAPYSHRSSPAAPPSSSRPPYGAEGNDKLASTREIKSLKQREYARQLEDDRLMRDRSQKQQEQAHSPYRPTGMRARDRELDSHNYQQQQVTHFGSEGAGAAKSEKQREYARQLQRDQMVKVAAQSQEESPNRARQQVRRRPVTPEQIGQDEGSFWGRGVNPSEEKAAKRREQEAYARQIREAAEQDAILTPRVSLAAAHQRRGSNRDSATDSATGLILGSDVSTAVHNERKKQQQQKYRQELASSASAPPIEAPRASLRSHRGNGGRQGDDATAGLIGHHESDAQQRERKREAQRKYAEDLSREEAERVRQQGAHEEGPRRGARPRMASPISYSSQPSYGAESNYSHQYSSRELPPSDTELELEYLRMLKEKAACQVAFNPEPPSSHPYSHHRDTYGDASRHGGSRSVYDDYETRGPPRPDYNGVTAAQATAAAAGSPYRGKPKYSMTDDERDQWREEAVHRQAHNPLDSPHRVAAKSLAYEKPPTSQCTGLVIGGMNVHTAAERAGRHRQQQQYAEDLAEAASATAIEQPRESWAERHRYKGNGLPGEYVGQRGASVGGGHSSVVLGDEGPTQLYHGGAQGSPGRMHRRGKQEEYAAQLRLQVQDSKQVRAAYVLL